MFPEEYVTRRLNQVIEQYLTRKPILEEGLMGPPRHSFLEEPGYLRREPNNWPSKLEGRLEWGLIYEGAQDHIEPRRIVIRHPSVEGNKFEIIYDGIVLEDITLRTVLAHLTLKAAHLER